ncbi:MAG TPA: helix-turn-helix domain-containing protein [Stellaceae bacterium]|nr:helix-turn-helix domain-containing protein [Stellaceae bacterium]
MPRAKRPRRRATPATPENRLIDAALTLAARQGWRQTGLADIAAEARMSLAEVYALHRSKAGILVAFLRRVDAEVLGGADAGSDEGRRDRLFDTLMRRFEALKPHKAAVRAILRDSVGRPAAVLGVAALRRSMRWMLEASGIATTGCRGRLMISASLALYGSVMRVFLNDDSDDLAATMAALDRALKRAEGWCRYLPRGRWRPQADAA